MEKKKKKIRARLIHREDIIDFATLFSDHSLIYFSPLFPYASKNKTGYNICDLSVFPDINRRGLERRDVHRYPSLRRRRECRYSRLRLLHHPLHMR